MIQSARFRALLGVENIGNGASAVVVGVVSVLAPSVAAVACSALAATDPLNRSGKPGFGSVGRCVFCGRLLLACSPFPYEGRPTAISIINRVLPISQLVCAVQQFGGQPG